jgi:hypothetical protein
MNSQQIETNLETRHAALAGEQKAEIIRQGLLIRQHSGTVSAIEFLKTHAIDAALIQSVMSLDGMFRQN